MPTAPDNHAGLPHARRFRIDDRAGSRPFARDPGTSGRRFVLGFLVVVVVVWGTLYAAFINWRTRYRALADFGSSQVATTVDPLAGLAPPEVPPAAWRGAVQDTHLMIEKVTASGPLSRPDLEALRADYAGRVAAARPESAVAVLAGIWGDLELRAGPVLHRPGAPQPALLVLARTIDPLARDVPDGVSVAAWNRTLEATRVLLVDLVASRRLTAERREDLRAWWSLRVAAARPETAVTVLTKVWDQVEANPDARPILARHPRPGLLGGAPAHSS
jgi:hypothetical protein